MDFSVSEKMQTILGMIKEFVQKELIPLEPEFLTKSFSEMLPVLEEKRQMVRQMELWAPLHPKEYGGMELNLLESALVFEALGGTPLGCRQYRDPASVWNRRAKRKICSPPDRGQNQKLLFHDRSGFARFQSRNDGYHRSERR
jgi:hypothetical protein